MAKCILRIGLSKLYIPHLSPYKKHVSVFILHLGIIRVIGNMYVRQSKRMLALETDLTLISPRRKKTSQQMVFAQGFTPKSQVMPTQKGPVK